MSSAERAVAALEAVLRSALRARPADGPHRDVVVTLDDADFLVRWLSVGWPRQVAEALPPPASRRIGCTVDVTRSAKSGARRRRRLG